MDTQTNPLRSAEADAQLTQLEQQLQAELPAYVLIDPACGDPLLDDPALSAWRDVERHLMRPRKIGEGQQPYLIALHGKSERAIMALLQRCFDETLGQHDTNQQHPRSICAWLTPWENQPSTLARRLSQRALLHVPGGGELTFRYWDPRLASQLPRLLEKTNWQHHLDILGLRRWACLLPGPAGITWSSLPEAPQKTAIDPPYHWAPSMQEWQKLNTLSWANRINKQLSSWEIESPEFFVLENLARRALQHGLTHEVDILRFTHCALTLHPQFDTHPEVAAALHTVATAGQLKFNEIYINWQADFIEQLKTGQWLRTSGHSDNGNIDS